MRGNLLALALIGLAGSATVRADGLLIPTDRGLPPLRLTYQRVDVSIVGRVATTKVEQSYHNSTDRDLEAEYIFPLPAGASVRDFSMYVGGKQFKGEAIDASKARQTYEDIVRRLQDPGLLEYIGRPRRRARFSVGDAIRANFPSGFPDRRRADGWPHRDIEDPGYRQSA